MKKNIINYRWHSVALISSLALVQPSAEAQTWQQPGKSTNPSQPQWSVVNNNAETQSQTPIKPPATPKWTAVEPDKSIDAMAELKTSEAKDETIYPRSGTTFANDKALWRDDQCFPNQQPCPVGFGPQGYAHWWAHWLGLHSSPIWSL